MQSSLSHSLALSDSSLPTPLKPSLCFRMQDALHSLRSISRGVPILKMKLDAPPSNWICASEKKDFFPIKLYDSLIEMLKCRSKNYLDVDCCRRQMKCGLNLLFQSKYVT